MSKKEVGLTDWIPGVSQLKSAVQLLTGDVKGAAETQKNFLHSCPGVAQATSVAYLAVGDTKSFNKTNDNSFQVISGVADGIPGVGHVKAAVHELAGDYDGAKRAFNAANRTSCVMGAGAAGFLVGGPVGAVVGGAAAGFSHDGAVTIVTNKPQGLINVIDKAVKDPSAGNIFDAAFCPVADGMTGYAGGQFVKNAATANQIAANKAKLDSMSGQYTDMMGGDGGTGGSGGGAWQLSEAMRKLNAETMALEQSLGVGDGTVNPKTGRMEGAGSASRGTFVPQSKQNGKIEEKLVRVQPKPEPVRSRPPVYAAPREITRTVEPIRVEFAKKIVCDGFCPLLEKPSQRTKTITKDPLTLLESLEELLVYKDQVLMFQEVVFEKFGFHLELDLCKVAIEFLITCYEPLKEQKRKGVQLSETFQTLIEESVENEDEDDDEDKEVDRTLRCIQWNMCGFVAQTLNLNQKRAKKWLVMLKTLAEQFDTGLVINSVKLITLLLQKRPHVLLLNELKVREDDNVKFRSKLLGYDVVLSSSDKSGRAAIRGTAIAYRTSTFLKFISSDNKRPIVDDSDRPVLEVVKANFVFHSKQKIHKNGMTDVLKKHNLTFVGAYLCQSSTTRAEEKTYNFEKAISVFNEFEDGLTIFAGDLNMEKTEGRQKWLAHGFVDMLQPGWKTNKQSGTETEIDYVMVKTGNEHYVTVKKPIKFGGRSIHYPIYFEVHDSIAIGKPGKRFKPR